MSQEDPVVNIIADPVLLDKEIAAIQAAMSTLPWLAKSFGRAFKHFKTSEGSKVSFPAIFQAWKKDYYNAFPTDHVISQSFVFADPSEVTENHSKKIHQIEKDISIIVFFDMERIDNTLEYPFQEKLKEDVIIALSIVGNKRLEINEITDDIEEVYNDFSVSEIKTEFLQERYGAFKFDCTLFYKNENCDLNVYAP